MVEFTDAKSFSTSKYNKFLTSVDEHANHLKRCAEIILQIETDTSLTLNEKSDLRQELGTKLEKIKLDNKNIIDMLFTDYQVHEATRPRINQDLSGFQILKEKVASKDKNFKLSKEEAENDNSFYYRE
ncbi:TPA: hypothetical protein R8C65_002702 [Staphylococcus aureus]|uniref:hypothetical protein n=1 Tax=Staphylococcus TaxID=1279 RepID=UPI000B7F258D|nr:hypothetical protein [Staphylococcus aureus]HDA2604482.1 hypothetical protein [Staphylococcus aureus]HEE8759896.1 hypothetical protein [Staphylococcus aureus]